MKTKNRSLLVLSLLICCCCSLHAVPSEPTAPPSVREPTAPPQVTDPTTPVSKTLTFTEKDSGGSYIVKTSQVVLLEIALSADLDDDPFTFKDSSLLNIKKRPYIFEWNGLTTDATADSFILALNSENSPIALGASSESYSHINADATQKDEMNFDLMRTISFSFLIVREGSTTLTFENGSHSYTYKITVVDNIPKTPEQEPDKNTNSTQPVTQPVTQPTIK
jgi:hypothetical protein